ncbi:Unknown protein sequence [Pseudomonas amygdali pv. myricae]|nr:Unknown protein sequence [Pseudomonas amygdali pv. myricae]
MLVGSEAGAADSEAGACPGACSGVGAVVAADSGGPMLSGP